MRSRKKRKDLWHPFVCVRVSLAVAEAHTEVLSSVGTGNYKQHHVHLEGLLTPKGRGFGLPLSCKISVRGNYQSWPLTESCGSLLPVISAVKGDWGVLWTMEDGHVLMPLGSFTLTLCKIKTKAHINAPSSPLYSVLERTKIWLNHKRLRLCDRGAQFRQTFACLQKPDLARRSRHMQDATNQMIGRLVESYLRESLATEHINP